MVGRLEPLRPAKTHKQRGPACVCLYRIDTHTSLPGTADRGLGPWHNAWMLAVVVAVCIAAAPTSSHANVDCLFGRQGDARLLADCQHDFKTPAFGSRQDDARLLADEAAMARSPDDFQDDFLSQVYFVVKSTNYHRISQRRGRLSSVLSTWYTEVTPENVMLILGTDTKRAAPPMSQLGHGSAVWFACGGTYSNDDLFCKTALAVESIRALESTEGDAPVLLETILTDQSRPRQRQAEALFLNSTSRLTVHRHAKIQWYCVLDDDLYVNVERLALFLKDKDASSPQMYGSFCASAFEDSSTAHACGAFCASAPVFRAHGGVTSPDEHFKHAATGVKESDDILLGKFLPAQKHDVASMLTQYDTLVRPDGSALLDSASQLHALKQTLIFNFETHLPRDTSLVTFHTDVVSTDASATPQTGHNEFERDIQQDRQCRVCPGQCTPVKQCVVVNGTLPKQVDNYALRLANLVNAV